MSKEVNKVLSAAANHVYENSAMFDWLMSQPTVKAQSYFWNYSGRKERRKAILKDMQESNKVAA